MYKFRRCFDKTHNRSSRNAMYKELKTLIPVNFLLHELKNYNSKTCIEEQYMIISKLYNHIS